MADQNPQIQDGVQAAYTRILDQMGRQTVAFSSLDTKVGILVGFVMASLAEIVAALIISASEHPGWALGIDLGTEAAFLFGLIFIFCAALFGVWTLWPRPTSLGDDLVKLAEEVESTRTTATQAVENLNPNEQSFKDLLYRYASNEKQLLRKGTLARCSGILVIAAIGSLSLSAGLIFFRICMAPPQQSKNPVSAQKAPLSECPIQVNAPRVSPLPPATRELPRCVRSSTSHALAHPVKQK